MLRLIRELVADILNKIDTGNTNISESELEELLDLLQRINSPYLTKLESADYIGVCRATFDNYVNKGLLPKGLKRRGSGLFWKKSDLDIFLKNKKK